jgi:putative ABC transport system substrate-binding protein
MNRRDLLVAFSLGALAEALPALAQQKGKLRRIGFLYFGSRQSALDTGRYNAFLQGMRELGYAEGKQFVIEGRFADGKTEGVPALAAELVNAKVEVIVATGTAVYSVLQRTTTVIPVVVTVSPDPVGEGYAKSLARPGGNITGLSTRSIDLDPKHIETLMSAVPKLARIAVLWNPANPGHLPRVKNLQAVAKKLGLQALGVEGRTPQEIERGFVTMARERTEAVIVLTDVFFVQQMRQIAELAIKHRLPSIFGVSEYPEAGGFMSYGQDITANFHRAATFVDKILKGAKPGELPFEQSMKFNMVVNRKTAQAIGLTIPQELLLRADRVIE